MTSALAELLMRLADAPVLPLARFDAKRKELVLCAAAPGVGGPLGSVIGRASPTQELLVLAADDALDLMDELSRPEYAGPVGGIRLAEPADVSWRFHSIDGDPAIRGISKNHRSVVYFERRSRVDEFGNTQRGGVWWGDECRKDQSGVEWTRYFADLVTDDYGQLVSSDTGVAP